MIFRQKGDKRKFSFLDADCLGRSCFSPGTYQHRGATVSGSRNTGDYSDCCMNRAYRGCPYTLPVFDAELAKARKKEGWRNG